MNIKRSLIIPAILSTLLFTGCGNSKKSFEASDAYIASNKAHSASSDNSLNFDSTGESAESYEGSDSDSFDDSLQKENNTSDEIVKKEMLVYTCDMTVDVLEFDKAITAFRNSLDIYGAFIEKEQYSDGGSNGRWTYSDSEKWQTYTATVRVPSKSYADFCASASDLGDLRSKHAGVQNLSAEYYDLSTTLEIYEAKEKRYMELLSTIKDEQYAISVERELTDIQIDISKIRTRMKDIRTDVAYSYVYITINEVREYVAEPVKTDTFLQRLANTVKRSTAGFLDFLEEALFFIIYVLPYAVIFVIVIIIIVKLKKLIKRNRPEKSSKKAKKNAAPEPETEAPAPETETEESEQ